MNQSAPVAIRREDYRPPAYRVETVALEFDLRPEATVVTSRLQMRAAEPGRPLVLDGEDLELLSIALDGRPLGAGEYSVDDRHLTVPNPPASFVLEIGTRINPKANTHLSGLYISNNVFCTRSEEHTSELQSRENLVCRLLLEKKKKKENNNNQPQ